MPGDQHKDNLCKSCMKTRAITAHLHKQVIKMVLKEYKNFVGDNFYATTGMSKLQQYRYIEKSPRPDRRQD